MVGGVLTALVLAGGILGQTLGGWWGGRVPRHRILVWALALNIPPLVLMAFVRGPALILVALIWGITHFTYQPVANAWVSDISSSLHRGRVYGILTGLTFGVGSLAATLAGAMGDRWGTGSIFVGMALLLIPAVIIGLLLRRAGGGVWVDSR